VLGGCLWKTRINTKESHGKEREKEQSGCEGSMRQRHIFDGWKKGEIKKTASEVIRRPVRVLSPQRRIERPVSARSRLMPAPPFDHSV